MIEHRRFCTYCRNVVAIGVEYHKECYDEVKKYQPETKPQTMLKEAIQFTIQDRKGTAMDLTGARVELRNLQETKLVKITEAHLGRAIINLGDYKAIQELNQPIQFVVTFPDGTIVSMSLEELEL